MPLGINDHAEDQVSKTTTKGTALAVVQDRAPVAMTPDMSFDTMMAMGDKLASTGFLPAHIRTGAQAAAIILTGRELGMQPMRALRSLVMVKGKVTESADSQLSRFKADGGHASFTSLTEAEAVLVLRHPNGDEHTERFTMQDAQRAGIATDMYKKYPKAMLRSRAITAGLKSLGWEGGVGMYDPDELGFTPEPEIEDAETVDAPTDAQLALLDRIMRSHVFTDRERQRVAEVSTRDKAKAAIDWATETVKARKAAEKSEDEATDDDDVELICSAPHVA